MKCISCGGDYKELFGYSVCGSCESVLFDKSADAVADDVFLILNELRTYVNSINPQLLSDIGTKETNCIDLFNDERRLADFCHTLTELESFAQNLNPCSSEVYKSFVYRVLILKESFTNNIVGRF